MFPRTRAIMLGAALVLSQGGCFKPPAFREYTQVRKNEKVGVTLANVKIEKVGDVELLGFRPSFESVFGSVENFKEQFASALSNRIQKEPSAEKLYSLRISKVVITETRENRYLWLGSIYCILTMDFEIRDSANAICWAGQLAARSSNAEFPSMHPNDARLRHAFNAAQEKVTDLLSGKIH